MVLLKGLGPFSWGIKTLCIVRQYSVGWLISTGHGGSEGCTHVLDVSEGLSGELRDRTLGFVCGAGVRPGSKNRKREE